MKLFRSKTTMARPKFGGALKDDASAGDETVTVSNVSFRQDDTREQPIPKQIPVCFSTKPTL